MSNLHRGAATPRFLVLVLAIAASLTLAGAASAEFPTKRSDPGIVGTPQEGQTLNGRTGQWLLDNGLKCELCKMSYTWQRCQPDGSGCADVPGRTGFEYVLGAADVGMRIRFVEWIQMLDCGATNTQTGVTECQDIKKNGVSPLTPPIAANVRAATPSNAPTLQGTAMEDEVLRATGATWAGTGTITTVIYWQRCNAVGEGCATIDGATGLTYRLTAADVGGRIRVVETATNEGGTAQAVSEVSAVVDELRPTARRQTLPAAKVALPHRLVLDQVVTRQNGSTVTVRVKVSDDRGFRVSGIQVRVTPTALLSGSAAARISNAQGWATFVYRATGAGSTYLYVDARRRGERPQSGISTANLFKVRIR